MCVCVCVWRAGMHALQNYKTQFNTCCEVTIMHSIIWIDSFLLTMSSINFFRKIVLAHVSSYSKPVLASQYSSQGLKEIAIMSSSISSKSSGDTWKAIKAPLGMSMGHVRLAFCLVSLLVQCLQKTGYYYNMITNFALSEYIGNCYFLWNPSGRPDF